jgi:hypothetical protein
MTASRSDRHAAPDGVGSGRYVHAQHTPPPGVHSLLKNNDLYTSDHQFPDGDVDELDEIDEMDEDV